MARKVEAPDREVSEQLGKYLDDAIPDLRQILHGFPESNANLKYPSISIELLPTDYQNFMPYVYEQGSVSSSKAAVKWVVGQFNWSIQLDLWERSKEERHDLFQNLLLAFNPSPPTTGIHLALENYHDVVCSYEITGFSQEDNEASSQRKEWRGIVNLLANCKAIVEIDAFIIEETEVTLETPDNIPES